MQLGTNSSQLYSPDTTTINAKPAGGHENNVEPLYGKVQPRTRPNFLGQCTLTTPLGSKLPSKCPFDHANCRVLQQTPSQVTQTLSCVPSAAYLTDGSAGYRLGNIYLSSGPITGRNIPMDGTSCLQRMETVVYRPLSEDRACEALIVPGCFTAAKVQEI